MTEKLQRKLRDSKAARWAVLIIVSFTMFCGYYMADVMAPLMDLLKDQLGWSGTEYGLFNNAYGWLNVWLFMLIISGFILDKIGARITGIGACLLMIIGGSIKYYAISQSFDGTLWGIKNQVIIACIGFSIFALGIESAGITVTKVIVRWFKGYEMALAMGIQVSIARLGTGLAMVTTIPLVKYFHNNLPTPILLGLFILCIGLLFYLVFCVMDIKLDKTDTANADEVEDPFRLRDVLSIIYNRGFWLISILCVLFYSGVFPFLKFATSLVINKYHVDEDFAGAIPSILPLGTILLTPLFGNMFDKKGKGASMMIIGSALLTIVHLLFALPLLSQWQIAALLMIFLGIAFSLVPSAMWPAVPKIIPENKLGTAYALIFWVQNVGLSMVPLLIGWILDQYCIIGVNEKGGAIYDYTLPMIVFAIFGVLAFIISLLLKNEDKKKSYGLELPNIEQ